MYTLTVAYMTSTTVLGNTQENSEPDKIMYYVLEKTAKDKYVICSIMDSEEPKENNESQNQQITSDSASSSISKTESEISAKEE